MNIIKHIYINYMKVEVYLSFKLLNPIKIEEIHK